MEDNLYILEDILLSHSLYQIFPSDRSSQTVRLTMGVIGYCGVVVVSVEVVSAASVMCV